MAITLVGTATASTTTVTIPGHVAGDIIIISAVRASNTPATIPVLYTKIQSAGIATATAVSLITGYKIATGTGDTSGTWTNASNLTCHVYRPSAGATILVGQSATSTSTTATISFPSLTLADTSGNSWIVAFAGASDITQNLATAPTGMTNESTLVGSANSIAGHDTEGGVSSWSVQTTASGATGHSVSMTIELVLSAFGTAPSNIYQHEGGGGNPWTRGITGNSFKLPLSNPCGTGNCLVLAITYDGGATVSSVTGAVNGSFGSPAVTALAGAGNNDSGIYVLPNITSGQETITVVFGSAVQEFQYCLTELYGVATSSVTNGTSSTNNVTTTAAGSFTPGNNNVNGGNLLWSYHVKSDENPTTVTTGFFPGSGFKLLNADIAWAKTSTQLPKAVQTFIQTTSAAINPAVTSVAETGDHWNNLAVALKLSSGAGTAPPTNLIRMAGVQHFTTANFPATGMYAMQASATGNLRCISSPDPNINTLTVWDSEGVTWTPDGNAAGFWYRINTTPNPNLIIYTSGGGGDLILSWRFYDISNAATIGTFNSSLASNQGVANVTSFTASPSPSPTSVGLSIANIGLGQGPGLGVTSPSGAIWGYCIYTGELDLDLMENADIMAHYVNLAGGAQTWTFTITSQTSNSTSGGFITFLGPIGQFLPATGAITLGGQTAGRIFGTIILPPTA